MDSILEKRFTLGDLLDTSALGEVLHAATQCFDLGIVIADEAGNEALSSCPEHRFCIAAKSSSGPGRCAEVGNRLRRHPIEEGLVLQIKSFCGLRYALFPLSYQLDILGRVIVGPFRDPDTDSASILGMMGQQGKGLEAKDVEKIPALSPNRLRLIIKLLAKIFDVFLFINAKRLFTTGLHLDTIFNSREAIFKQMEKQDQGSREDKEEIEKLKDMF